jgi:two-component system cell cycle response regulator
VFEDSVDLIIIELSYTPQSFDSLDTLKPVIVIEDGTSRSFKTNGILKSIKKPFKIEELYKLISHILRKRKIVVIDDSPNFRAMVGKEFDSEKYEVFFAENGLEGLSLVSKIKPDLVTMDVEMPVMDGYKACRLIRENPETESIPVVFVTTLDREEDINRGYNAGGIEYFIKPFPKGALEKFVFQLLNKIESRKTLEIAILDNNKNSSKVIEYIFSKNGFKACVFADGAAFADYFNSHIPAMIVINIDIDYLPFEQTIKELKGLHDDIPIIAVTVEDSKAKIIRALKSGAVDYIHAPFVEEELIARVETHLKIYNLLKKLTEMNKKLEELSVTDPLTKLYNRGFFNKAFKQEIKRLSRAKGSLACIMLDIDHFKKINDTYGHAIGDFILIETANILKELPRTTDIVARYGGEEFVILLPETNKEGALTLAEKIRKRIEESVFEKEEIKVKITISCGVYCISDFLEGKNLIKFADDALYKAKNSGRNKVVYYEDE